MDWHNLAAREAYIQGARDALDSVAITGDPRERRAVEAWIVELEGWAGGDPPSPPCRWE